MFGMSGEHLLILGIVLLIFGPRRLPELGNTLGRSIRNFKDAISGVEEAKFRKIEEDEQKRVAKLVAEAQTQAAHGAQASVKNEPPVPLTSAALISPGLATEKLTVGQSSTRA